ncbi:MAG: thioesterase family protein [Acidimicrobiales bacterium]|nr:thioesterase family protein [Acidimicrobiales bacterium]
MDAKTFLGLESTHNPNRWILPVTPGVSTRGNFLWGGCGLGAAIEAMEGTTGRPVIWATAQYLSYANPPSIMDIDVVVANAGRSVTQARATGHVGDREILTVNAALGARDVAAQGAWETMPDVPAPEDCEVRFALDDTEGMMSRLDFRLADARNWDAIDGNPSPDGNCSMWARMPDVLEMSGAALAILGDYVPFGLGQALGKHAGGNSLDNTLRMVEIVQTDWVLLDIRVHAIANGFGHGLVHLWAQDGTLLATASQSTILRFHEDFEKRRKRSSTAD